MRAARPACAAEHYLHAVCVGVEVGIEGIANASSTRAARKLHFVGVVDDVSVAGLHGFNTRLRCQVHTQVDAGADRACKDSSRAAGVADDSSRAVRSADSDAYRNVLIFETILLPHPATRRLLQQAPD